MPKIRGYRPSVADIEVHKHGFSQKKMLDVLILRASGLQYRDISVALDIPLGTVRSRIHRAKNQLNKMLDEEAVSELAKTF